ncbi:hypothetical protein RD792_010741 [Penstemon davidsonii]|uniref:CSC1-like protein At3g54510 n=1 Tax=Penstemon davidsonii TaxID=160366 RepID=A0ABR0D2S3_9LAMI|nr:hypothetical protein RD792_010741 [Penstemon davidsonii]
MEGISILASTALNVILGLINILLYSIFIKQPSNATIYYARRVSVNESVPFDHSSSFLRYIPSFGWITSALRVSEDEILEISGLDALVLTSAVLLKMKFYCRIRFFLVCSVVGLLVLLPLNYVAGGEEPWGHSHTMDSFTISSISKGSDWLWVHCLCLYFVSFYGLYLLYKELPVAFVTFKSRWGAALAAQSQQTSNPLLWVTEMAPEPRDVLWKNLSIPYRCLPLYNFGVYLAATLLTIFFAVPVTAVQGIAKFERLKRWFPPAMAVQLIPGLRSIVTGYLPSAILNSFVYVVPFAMIEMAKMAGYISRSRKDIKACNMVFYFLVGNVFFLSLLSGSLLDQIGESFSHPRDFPGRLASAVSAQADFFMTYILTNGLSGFSLEILQPALLIWDAMKSHTWDRGKKKRPYLYSLPYYRTIPFVALCILIGMVYAVVSPLLLPFLVGYFLLGYIVFINQIQDVYITTYETSGQYWPFIHQYILVAIVIMQITMIGLFGLKSKPAASFSTIPLLVFTLLFNEYCKLRFLPTFYQCSVKVEFYFSFPITL